MHSWCLVGYFTWIVLDLLITFYGLMLDSIKGRFGARSCALYWNFRVFYRFQVCTGILWQFISSSVGCSYCSSNVLILSKQSVYWYTLLSIIYWMKNKLCISYEMNNYISNWVTNFCLKLVESFGFPNNTRLVGFPIMPFKFCNQ